MAKETFLAYLNSKTAESNPDMFADYGLIKDTSGGDINKMLLWMFGQGAHGADIASAGTVNLDTSTGDCVDVTGTTTITAITLTDGRHRTVRFTGILTLTNGASLVLPTAANITTAAGDFAIFRGYAAGVVRCVLYSRANGQALAGAGGGMAIGGAVTSGTAGSVYFGGVAGALNQDNANLFWDDTNNFLGIAINAALAGRIHSVGNTGITALVLTQGSANSGGDKLFELKTSDGTTRCYAYIDGNNSPVFFGPKTYNFSDGANKYFYIQGNDMSGTAPSGTFYSVVAAKPALALQLAGSQSADALQVIDSGAFVSGGFAADGSSLNMGAVSMIPSVSKKIPANCGAYIPYQLEIPAGVTVEVGAGAVLEIG